jgi:hypothetical protein
MLPGLLTAGKQLSLQPLGFELNVDASLGFDRARALLLLFFWLQKHSQQSSQCTFLLCLCSQRAELR